MASPEHGVAPCEVLLRVPRHGNLTTLALFEES